MFYSVIDAVRVSDTFTNNPLNGYHWGQFSEEVEYVLITQIIYKLESDLGFESFLSDSRSCALSSGILLFP